MFHRTRIVKAIRNGERVELIKPMPLFNTPEARIVRRGRFARGLCHKTGRACTGDSFCKCYPLPVGHETIMVQGRRVVALNDEIQPLYGPGHSVKA